MQKLSVGLRFTLWYLAIFLLAEVFFGVFVSGSLRTNLLDIADTDLEGRAADLQRFLLSHKDLPPAELQAQLQERYKIDRSQDCVEVLDAAGQGLYVSRLLADHPIPSIPSDDVDRRMYRNYKIGEGHYRLVSEHLDLPGHAFTIHIARAMNQEFEILAAFHRAVLWSSCLFLLIAGCGGYWLKRQSSRTA